MPKFLTICFDEMAIRNSDWIGSYLQVRYLSGRVDIVVRSNKLSAVHEM